MAVESFSAAGVGGGGDAAAADECERNVKRQLKRRLTNPFTSAAPRHGIAATAPFHPPLPPPLPPPPPPPRPPLSPQPSLPALSSPSSGYSSDSSPLPSLASSPTSTGSPASTGSAVSQRRPYLQQPFFPPPSRPSSSHSSSLALPTAVSLPPSAATVPPPRPPPPLPPPPASPLPPSGPAIAASAPPSSFRPPPSSAPPPPVSSSAALPSFCSHPLDWQLRRLLALYLPERADLLSLPPEDPLLRLTSLFSSLFQHHHAAYLHPSELDVHRRVVLPFPQLSEQCAHICPDFATELHEQPTVVLPVLSAAAHHAAMTLRERGLLHCCITASTRITARLMHHSPLLPFRSVNSETWNRFVSFRCQVVKTSPPKPDLLAVRFSCKQCGASVVRRLQEGRYSEPKPAEVCGCLQQFSSGWKVDRTAVFQTDWQLVRVQEMVAGRQHYQHEPQHDGNSRDASGSTKASNSATSSSLSHSSSSNNGGLAPRFLECELRGDLVDQLIPGDVLTVSGILRRSEFEVFSRDRRERRKEWSLYMDANAINLLSRKDDSQLLSWITFEEDEVKRIMQLIADTQGRPFKWLVHSLCPTIYGHELVKVGLLLTLFGGSAEDDSAAKQTSDLLAGGRRCNPHILLVGDPQLGKSQLLQAVNNCSPRGVMLSGGVSTASGLTVTLIKEATSDSEYSLEAGALVLGDGGTCCIDEFDKLHSSQHMALLEAMEQQTISVAKAGTIIRLPARTSVFAAANPVGGYYDRSKTVSENIKLAGPLLSRFDLVYVMVDEKNTHLDDTLPQHVMSTHRRAAMTSTTTHGKRAGRVIHHQPSSSAPNWGKDGDDADADFRSMTAPDADADGASSLLASLQLTAAERSRPPLPASLIRLFVAYARRYVSCTFSTAAKSRLYHFYLRLRASPSSVSPITTRQLESLIRLAEARARADMRTEVGEDDAECVIELMEASIRQVTEDEKGSMDWERKGAGGRSKSKEVSRLLQHLIRCKREEGQDVWGRAELKAAMGQLGMADAATCDRVIAQLNEGGWLLQQRGDKFLYKEVQ